MKIRNLLVGLVLSVMILCSSAAVNGSKTAATQCLIVPYRVYYTDASMTVMCGSYSFCDDTYYGCETPYYSTTNKLCCQQ
jgi:hypothetical protein